MPPDRWDSIENRVKGNKEDAREVNGLIDSAVLRLDKIHSNLVDRGVTASRIKQMYFGDDTKNQTLLKAFNDHSAMMS